MSRRRRGAEWDVPFGAGMVCLVGVGGFLAFVVVALSTIRFPF